MSPPQALNRFGIALPTALQNLHPKILSVLRNTSREAKGYHSAVLAAVSMGQLNADLL